MIPSEWLDQAALRIAPHLRRTLLTNDAGQNIYLKWENQQVTGSFKLRGALNKVLSLEKWEQEAGLVTASAGNHGQGVALAGNLVNAPVTIFASNHAVTSKVEAMRALGAEVRLVEGGYEAAERTAIRYASEHSKTWVSAYNDGQVIAGQGTIGLEIAQELPPQAGMTWVVPVGGGGLLAGIGAALTRYKERPRLVGVQAEASAFMHSLFYRDAQHLLGTQENIPDLPTLADGLSGRIEGDSLTIPMLKQFADEIILVSEEEIAHAIAFAWHKYHERIEGSAAVALAPILTGKVNPPAVVVLSGGNIQSEVHAAICRRYSEHR
ncbi:MAG: pyridoxal-phosphate dependent enzyme [Anaerolineales bacterium]|nr:pyridoxal-phosphate dependent enzyme [Anaerolineales bacterium]